MSSPSSMPIPAGWYPDPAGSFQQRWWTGESWTNDFAQYRPTLVHSAPAVEVLLHPAAQQTQAASAAQAAPQAAATTGAAAQQNGQQTAAYAPTQTLTREQPPASVDPLPAFRLPDADQPPQTVVAQPNAGNATLIAVTPTYRTAPLNPDFSNDYLPFSGAPQVRAGHRLNPERRYTASAWLLAVLPLAPLGAAYALATLMPVLYTTFSQVAILIAALLIGLGLAALDRRVLYRDGHDRTAPPALALLTPLVFLLARSFFVGRETGRGAYGPFILVLVVAAAIAAAVLFVTGLLPLLATTAGLY